VLKVRTYHELTTGIIVASLLMHKQIVTLY
jgi:hypothetical protein